jgi:hypothetical protein
MQNVHKTVALFTKFQRYPASRDALINRLNGFREMPVEDKRWLKNRLPIGNYLSAESVIEALKIKSTQI